MTTIVERIAARRESLSPKVAIQTVVSLPFYAVARIISTVAYALWFGVSFILVAIEQGVKDGWK